jgi:hypothetical protein
MRREDLVMGEAEWLSRPWRGRDDGAAAQRTVDAIAHCPGAEAARAAIPARDIIEIGGDIAEAADSLRRVQHLIDAGLDVRLPEAAIKRCVLARTKEVMRQLEIVVAELSTAEERP